MGVNVRWNKHKKAWYVYVNHNKKRTSQAFGDDKQAALSVASEIKKAIKLGAFKIRQPSEKITLQEFAEKVFASNSERKPSTMRNYESRTRLHIFPALGDKIVCDVTKDDVQALIVQARKTMTARSVRHLIAVLHVILDAAVEAGILAANPADKANRTIKREHVVDDKIKFLTREQVSELLDAVKASYPRVFWAFMLCLARSGMRIGECSALRVSSVDFLYRRILINRTSVDGKYQTPKNGRERYVDMSDQLAEALRELCDGRGDEELLFTTPKSGKAVDSRLIRSYVWHPTIKTIKGVAGITPHILRHTFASQLISDGHPIAYVSRQLGHGSIEITMDVYGHLMPSADRTVVNSLDEPLQHPARILSAVAGCKPARKSLPSKPLAFSPLRIVR